MMFGADFERAKTNWLYPQQVMQTPWRGILFFVLLFIVNIVLQSAGGVVAFKLLGGEFAKFFTQDSASLVLFVKASIVGLFPSALVAIILILYLAQFGLPQRAGTLPSQIPQLSVLGWCAVLGGFAVLMYAIFIGAFAALGIDPQTYTPGGGGVLDDKSSAGMVEKTMSDLADEPLMFALALPGVILAAPLVEELLFRGALFSALATSRVGRFGAVVITSALWAAAHGQSAPLLFVGLLFIMGLVLGILLLRFGSLWVPIACHTLWNTISSLALLSVGAHS